MIKIERAAIDALGGSEKFDADVFTFKKALKDHAKTEGQAAPTAHPFVEQVVREGGGKYEVIEPVPVVLDTPVKSLEELQADALSEIGFRRHETMKSGVTLNGVMFSSTLDTLTAFMAAREEGRDDADPGAWSTRWRVGPGAYVAVNLADLDFLIKAIRFKHKKAFANEQRLSDEILSANTPEALAKIDLTEGWEV